MFVDKDTFVATKDGFCVCRDKTFVATKMILMAATADEIREFVSKSPIDFVLNIENDFHE